MPFRVNLATGKLFLQGLDWVEFERAPTTADNEYAAPFGWLDTSADAFYVLVNVTDAGVATWSQLGGGGGSGLTWNEVTGTSQLMSSGNGYVANNASLVTLTLPASSVFGDVIEVLGKGAGLFRIAQNAGQTLHFIDPASDTTTGTGGSSTAQEQYCSLKLRCITANTDWSVVSSTGNFTIV